MGIALKLYQFILAFIMYDLIFRMNNTRKIAIMYGLKEFPKDKIEEYEKEYDDILELAKEENKQSKTQYIQIVMQY